MIHQIHVQNIFVTSYHSVRVKLYYTTLCVCTFSWPCPMARNLSLLVPKPLRSASFVRSLAGSQPGLRINTMGEFGVLCSNIASKLITGGCTYLRGNDSDTVRNQDNEKPFLLQYRLYFSFLSYTSELSPVVQQLPFYQGG